MEEPNRKQIKSPINFRAFLLVASATVGAILCAYVYMLYRTVGIAVGVIYLAVWVTLASVKAVSFARKSLPLGRPVAFALALAFSVSAFSVAAAYTSFRTSALDNCGNRYVDGRLCAVDVSNDNYTLVLDNLMFDGESVRGKLKVEVRASSENIAQFLNIGDRVLFRSEISGVPLVSGMRVNGSSFRTGVIYTCSVRGDAIDMRTGKPKPIEKFLIGLKRILVDNMGYRYGNIAYSMITGDKYGLSSDVSSAFSSAGLGHVLAVSGLHVGFLILLIELVLFRTRKSIRFAVAVAAVTAYTVLADFSPSVTRAAIMTVISGMSIFVGGRRDLLSSMLCALSCILAVRPVYLFEAGFIMSFGAIFGIAAFGNTISRAFSSRGLNRKVSDSVGTALSVQAGIIPAQAYFFGTLTPLSVLVNIVMIPYLAVMFIAILVCLPIGAIGLGGAVGWCKYLLMPVDYIAQGIAAIPNIGIAAHPTCAVFLCYPIMFCMSDYYMLPKSKLPLVLYSVAICIALFVI